MKPAAYLIFLQIWAACAPASQLKPDEQILFYPALARRAAEGRGWAVEIQGSVFEADKRPLALALIREALLLNHVDMTKTETQTFKERTRLFMVIKGIKSGQ